VTSDDDYALSEALGAIDSYIGQRIVVTGGLGFIGSNLARVLVKLGAKVTLLDSLIPEYGGNLANISGLEPSLSVNVCDIRDPYAIRHLLSGANYIFNLAGQTSHVDSMTDPKTDLAINVGAQINLLECARLVAPEVKIVFASTRQIYGRPQYLPVDELHPIKPVDVNGINKWAGESYHTLYSEVYGLRSTVLRLTNTYGPRMRIRDSRQTFLGIWIRKVLEGDPFLVFGTGHQLRDFNYVDDVIYALLLAGADIKADGKVYNLGSSEIISLRDLAVSLCETASSGFEIVPFPEERKLIDIGDYFGDYSLIQQDLGWEPKVPLIEGLRLTLDYFASRLPEYCD